MFWAKHHHIILAVKVSFRVARKKYIFDMCIFNSFYLLYSYNPSFLICLCVNMVSLRDQKSLDHAQIGLLKGFNSKFPTSIPTPFICGVFPPPPGVEVSQLFLSEIVASPISSSFNYDHNTKKLK